MHLHRGDQMRQDDAIQDLFLFIDEHNSRYCKDLSSKAYAFVNEENIDPMTGEKNKSCVRVNDDGSITIRVAVHPSFFDKDTDEVSTYDFVSACIAASHETWHYKQLTSCVALGDFKYEVKSYLSRFDNDEVYGEDYRNFTFEIGAERHAIKSTKAILYDMSQGELPFERVVRDYTRGRNEYDKNAKKFIGYFIGVEDCTDLKSIETAFDNAYKKSIDHIKHFEKYPDDLVGSKIKSDPELKKQFADIKSGREETDLAVKIITDSKPDDKYVKRMTRAVKRGEMFDRIRNPLIKFRDKVYDKLQDLRNPKVKDIDNASEFEDDESFGYP